MRGTAGFAVVLMPLPPPPPPDTAPEAPLAITDAVASSLFTAVEPLAGLAVTMPAMPPADAGHATELDPSPEIQAASQAAAAASAEAACPWHRYVASEGPYAPCGSYWWHNEITDECSNCTSPYGLVTSRGARCSTTGSGNGSCDLMIYWSPKWNSQTLRERQA